jgi:hypothetical protein
MGARFSATHRAPREPVEPAHSPLTSCRAGAQQCCVLQDVARAHEPKCARHPSRLRVNGRRLLQTREEAGGVLEENLSFDFIADG